MHGPILVGKRDTSRNKIEACWADDAALQALLLTGSGLPGPRANLELAAAFAEVSASCDDPSRAWQRATRWAAIDPLSAPVNHPREFLPFCAVQALGALFENAAADRRAEIESLLRSAAADPRWRSREAAAMALQRIGAADFAALRSLCERWLERSSPYELRAVLAGLADPPLLASPAHACFALDSASVVLEVFAQWPAAKRSEEPFRIVRKALEYALSVYVAAAPVDGFARMRAWAESRDLDVRKIVVANLRKARLARSHPEEVEAVGLALSWSADDGELTDP